jgi:hypothetical protein
MSGETLKSLVNTIQGERGEDETIKILVRLLHDKCDGDKDEMDEVWEIVRLECGLENGNISFDGIARDNGHEISKIIKGQNLTYEEGKAIYIEKLKELHKNGNLADAFTVP